MPRFLYRALTPAGETVRGEIEAGDARSAVDRLKARGLIPVDARPSRRPRLSWLRMTPGRGGRPVTLAIRELAVLLSAGETLEAALSLVAEGLPARGLGVVLADARDRVRAGSGFAEALSAHPEWFDARDIAVIAAGEASGRLGEALAHLARVREGRERLRRQLRGALLYPAVLLASAVLAIGFILGFVVPQFAALVGDRRDALPAAARFVFAASDLLRSAPGTILAAALLPLALGWMLSRSRLAGGVLARLLYRLPVVGPLVRIRTSAELARGLALLLGGGVELPRAISLLREMLSNRHARTVIAEVARGVREGGRLGLLLERADILTATALRLLRTGEESARLEAAAAHVADRYEEELGERLGQLARVVEPLLILLLGVVVGGIVMAVLSAVLSLNRLAL